MATKIALPVLRRSGRPRVRGAALWVLLVLWTALAVPAQDRSVADRIRELPARQTACLAAIADSVQAVSAEQNLAKFFLGREPGLVNAAFAEMSGQGISPLELSVWLRALSVARGRPDVSAEARTHVEEELGRVMKAAEEAAPNTSAQAHRSEGEEILALSNRFVWLVYAELAGGAAVWPDAQSLPERKRVCREALQEWLTQRARYGTRERASAYYGWVLASLLNLRDFGGDEALGLQADCLVDILLAEIAQESLEHVWGGVHSRSFETISTRSEVQLHSLVFGLPVPETLPAVTDWLAFHWGQTGYRPPAALTAVGADRRLRGTYEIKTKFCPASGDGSSLTQERYSYVTPDFILSSFLLRDEPVPLHSRPWDLLVWDETRGENHLFLFLGDQLYSGGRDPDGEYCLWNGTSLQYKNVLFCQFHRSDRKRAGRGAGSRERIDRRFVRQPVRVWVPEGFSPVSEENGWWFVETGGVFVAFRPLEGGAYWWRTAEMADPTEAGAAIMSFQSLDTAFLLEMEEASRFSSFEQFKEQIKSSPLEVEADSVTFVSRQGDVLLFPRHGGDFLVNGRLTDEREDPAFDLYSSPYLQSRYGSGVYRIEWNPFSLLIDLSDPAAPKRTMQPALP